MRLAIALPPAGEALIGKVVAVASDDRANRHELLHRRRNPREHFADVDAGDAGSDGAELPADIDGGVHLEVPHVLMRRASRQ